MSNKLYRELYDLNNIYTITNKMYFTDNVNMYSNLYVNNTTTIDNNTTMYSDLNTQNYTSTSFICNNSMNPIVDITNNILNVNTSYSSDLLIAYDDFNLFNNLTCNNNIYSDKIIVNNLTINNLICNENQVTNLYVSNTIYTDNISTINLLYVSNTSIFENITAYTLMNTRYIANTFDGITMNSNTLSLNKITFFSNLNVDANISCSNVYTTGFTIANTIDITNNCTTTNILTNNLLCKLKEYPDNNSAITNGIPLNGLYRTGDIVKVRINEIDVELNLNGNSTDRTWIDIPYTDPGAVINNNTEGYTLYTVGTVSYYKTGKYIRYYNAVDGNNTVVAAQRRIINVYDLPTIDSINFRQDNTLTTNGTLEVNTIGVFDKFSYNVTDVLDIEKIANTLVTSLTSTYSEVFENLVSSGNPHTVNIFLQRNDDFTLTTSSYDFNVL